MDLKWSLILILMTYYSNFAPVLFSLFSRVQVRFSSFKCHGSTDTTHSCSVKQRSTLFNSIPHEWLNLGWVSTGQTNTLSILSGLKLFPCGYDSCEVGQQELG